MEKSPKGFRGRCLSKYHSLLAANEGSDDLILESNKRKCPSQIINWLVKNNKWTRGHRTSYICAACITFVQQQISEEIPNPLNISISTTSASATTSNPSQESLGEADDEDVIVNNVLKIIKNKSISSASLHKLAFALGEASRPQFEEQSKVILPQDKQELLLICNYTTTWESHCCSVFRSFVSGVLNLTVLSLKKRLHATRMLQKSLECIIKAINQLFISPLALRENIILHSFSGSRVACEMFGHSQASGSYKYALDTVATLQLQKPKIPKGDMYAGFDNQQKIGKQWHVSAGGSQRTSTVTSLVIFVDEEMKNLQNTVDLPIMLETPTTNAATVQKCTDTSNQLNHLHHTFRLKFIESRMKEVAAEMQWNSGDLEDCHVVERINSDSYVDGSTYDVAERKESIVNVTNLENILVNPNSKSTITTVLNHILTMSEESDPNRKWIVIHCDGLPYTIVSNLIRETYKCRNCDLSGKIDEVQSHICESLEADGRQIIAEQKYKKIILRPGAGHFEMNLVRAIFKIYFDIFIEPVAKMLGFTHEASLNYCKSAADHHKSWEILQIIRLALADELIYCYLSSPTTEDKTPSNFGIWRQQLTNKNYKMAFDFVFSCLHPLFLFRAGVRQANDMVSAAGLHKVASIFFGFNHPRYRTIYTRDFLYGLVLPPSDLNTPESKASKFVRRNSLIVKDSTVGQGVDMLVEEQNKEQKHWLIHSGVPTEKQWLSSSATLSYMQELKKIVVEDIGLTLPDSSQRKRRLREEILMARKYFRNFFATDVSDQLTTLTPSKTPLDDSFNNSMVTCKENQDQYIMATLTGSKISLKKIVVNPFSTLPEKEQLSVIKSSISLISDKDLKQYYNQKLEIIEKKEYEDLYYEIQDDIYEFEELCFNVST